MSESVDVRRMLHTRQVTCRGFVRGDDDIEVEATLQDISGEATQLLFKSVPADEPIHEMSMSMVVGKDLVIRSIAAVIRTAPTSDCPQASVVYEKLAGLRIGPGFLRSAKERIPAASGCTHLSDLLKTMATTAQQTCFALQRADRSSMEAASKLVDTCYAHRSGGVVFRLLEARS